MVNVIHFVTYNKSGSCDLRKRQDSRKVYSKISILQLTAYKLLSYSVKSKLLIEKDLFHLKLKLLVITFGSSCG